MKKLVAGLLMTGLLFVGLNVNAQTIVKGNLSALKGATGVNVVFTYNGLTVGKEGKEENYLKRKKQEKDSKEPGSGDKWIEQWNADKEKRYKPKFIQLLSKYTEWQLNEDTKEKYTMVVNTTFLEPGYYVGVSAGHARLNLEISIYEADNMNKALCRITMEDVKAGGGGR